jgi:hypothetical protein
MSAATPFRTLSRVSAIIAMLVCFAPVQAPAQAAPDTQMGRYTLTPMSGGFVRLDTRTGVVAHCTDKGSGWACYALPDEHAALDREIGRLQAENEQLKSQLAARDADAAKVPRALPGAEPPKAVETGPKANGPKSTGASRNSVEVPLPSDRDVDRVMSLIERAWRRLIEMAARLRNDQPGGI